MAVGILNSLIKELSTWPTELWPVKEEMGLLENILSMIVPQKYKLHIDVVLLGVAILDTWYMKMISTTKLEIAATELAYVKKSIVALIPQDVHILKELKKEEQLIANNKTLR